MISFIQLFINKYHNNIKKIKIFPHNLENINQNVFMYIKSTELHVAEDFTCDTVGGVIDIVELVDGHYMMTSILSTFDY